jgi:hypothetical protein
MVQEEQLEVVVVEEEGGGVLFICNHACAFMLGPTTPSSPSNSID